MIATDMIATDRDHGICLGWLTQTLKWFQSIACRILIVEILSYPCRFSRPRGRVPEVERVGEARRGWCRCGGATPVRGVVDDD